MFGIGMWELLIVGLVCIGIPLTLVAVVVVVVMLNKKNDPPS